MPYFQADDCELFYTIEGTETEGTLICLHGWGTNLNLWSNINHHLDSWRIVKIDLPGMGLSPYPNSLNAHSYLIQSAEYLLKFILSLESKKLVILGHSIGGILATLLASHRSVQGLILDSTPLLGLRGVATKVKLFGVPFLNVPFYASLQSSKILKKLIHNTFEDINLVPKPTLELLVEAFQQSSKKALFDSLQASISCIALDKIKQRQLSFSYIIGANNQTLDQEMMIQAIEDSGVRGTIKTVPAARHYAQLEQPKFYYKELNNFLNEIKPVM